MYRLLHLPSYLLAGRRDWARVVVVVVVWGTYADACVGADGGADEYPPSHRGSLGWVLTPGG